MSTLAALPLLSTNGDWDHHGWWPVWLLFWAALIGLTIWFVVRRRGRGTDPLDAARGVLAERYARGEIGAEEYRERLDGLDRDRR